MRAQPAEDEGSNWGKVIGGTADRNANVSFLGNENSRSTTCARGNKMSYNLEGMPVGQLGIVT